MAKMQALAWATARVPELLRAKREQLPPLEEIGIAAKLERDRLRDKIDEGVSALKETVAARFGRTHAPPNGYEYPRPELARSPSSWMSLCGEWRYMKEKREQLEPGAMGIAHASNGADAPISASLFGLASEIGGEVIERFGRRPDVLAYGPARANLIGEHVDNFGGKNVPTKSIPFAIDRQIVMGGVRSDDRTIEVTSLNLDATAAFAIDDLTKPGFELDEGWGRFVQAVAIELINRGHEISGLRGVLKGNIPGKGVSSSAALSGALVQAFNGLFNLGLSADDVVEISRAAERRTGVHCGYLDQMASVHGRPNEAVVVGFYADGKPTCESIPMDLGDAKIAGVDTGRTRDLKTSQYNARMAECKEQALPLFAKMIAAESGREITAVGEITADDFKKYGDLATVQRFYEQSMSAEERAAIPKEKLPTLIARVRHVVSEMQREEQVEAILRSDDPNKAEKVGAVLTACHASLRDDFGVSCPELDFLVDSATRHGAYGARLMGAGEGGNMIVLAPEDKIDGIVKKMLDEYRVAFPERKTTTFECAPSIGSGTLPVR